MSAISGLKQAVITRAANNMLAAHEKTMPRKQALVATLREIGAMLFPKNGLALEHIERFLQKTSGAAPINLKKLLNEDSTVKRRVIEEVHRRALGILTIGEKNRLLGPIKPVGGNGIDPVITIFQYNYSNIDWWGALGTFPLTLKFLGVPRYLSKNPVITVSLSGNNEYKWYPFEDRPSKRVHEIGAEILSNGDGRNFDMKADEVIFQIDSSKAAILEMVTFMQTDPKAGSLFTGDQIMSLIGKLP